MEYIGISLQEYLIRYSEVDRQFIKDFIAIQQSDVSQEHYPFIVESEIISKWLKIDKKHIKRTLIKSYIENIDYIILLPPGGKQDGKWGGHNKEILLSTVKCFKKICLKTKSIMSDKIIDYYLALENLLIEYQQYIISILIDENKLLKNDLNNDIFPQGGLIYVMDLGNGYYKLGFTQDLKQRKMIYDTGSIHKKPIVFWFETEDTKTIEACTKGLLTKFAIKKKKEVYFTELKNIIFAIKGCEGVLSNLTCEVCQTETKMNDIGSHFKKYHPNILNTNTLFEASTEQHGGGSDIEKCLEYLIIQKKTNSAVYLITDHISGFKYIIKKGTNIIDEYMACHRLDMIDSSFVSRCLSEIYSSFVNKKLEQILVMEYIKGYTGYELDKIDFLNNKSKKSKHEFCWLCLIYQLSYFITLLEDQKIQHNDFHLGNIMIEYDQDKKKFQLKVLDLETLTDYKNPIIYSSMVKNASNEEKIRMGWNDKFHPGSDLNQILGELLERYGDIMPKSIVNEIEPRIKKYDKEFPYAISESNKETTGEEILMIYYRLQFKQLGIKV